MELCILSFLLDMIVTLTTIRTVFTRRGMEKTSDMNIPFESKYWKLEKDLNGEMFCVINLNVSLSQGSNAIIKRRDKPPVHGSQLI